MVSCLSGRETALSEAEDVLNDLQLRQVAQRRLHVRQVVQRQERGQIFTAREVARWKQKRELQTLLCDAKPKISKDKDRKRPGLKVEADR